MLTVITQQAANSFESGTSRLLSYVSSYVVIQSGVLSICEYLFELRTGIKNSIDFLLTSVNVGTVAGRQNFSFKPQASQFERPAFKSCF